VKLTSTITHSFSKLALRVVAVVVCSEPWQVWAQLDDPPDISGKDIGDLRGAIISVAKKVLNLMAAIAVVVICIAGIRLIVSNGEESAKETAKKTIIYALVGLIIIMASRAIVEFVFNI